MPSFDFIADKHFRQSLESDFSEMLKSISSDAWKSAQVIAGSVVEALLIDHLISVPGLSGKDPLKLDLGEAITICRDRKILSQRSADLCSVVRSYRNLIHPGRVVRLDEPSPNRESASIALSLVEMITTEISKVRQQQVGLTAEQLVSKIERDADSLSIFKHLALEANEHQRQRLLLEVLPQAYAGLGEFDGEDVSRRMESAFGTTLSIVDDDVRKKVAADFVRILREADGSYVTRYADAFFRATSLHFVSEQHRLMVVGYLLGRLDTAMSVRTLIITEGICPFVPHEEAHKWTDPLIRVVVNPDAGVQLKARARRQLEHAYIGTQGLFDRAVIERFEAWKVHFKKNEAHDKAKVLEEIEENMLPF